MNTSSTRNLLLFLLLAVSVLAACWFTPATDRARAEVKDGLERALTVFAAARALGAVVSVAQGTQVDLQPGGVGVSLAPGQALQPLDQLIDQFAKVMLVASVSFGIQLLLLEIGTHWVVSAMVSAAVLAVALLRWRGGAQMLGWLQPALIVLLVMRFAVPLSALANEALYRAFMADEYRIELADIKESVAAALGPKDAEASSDEGIWARIQRWKQQLPNLKASYDAILDAASDWSRTMVKLIALFVVQTILFPVAFLWLAWKFAALVVRGAVRLPASASTVGSTRAHFA